ncbi:MAG: hypothetical protein R3343_01845 [Nitriliruptorales bacterium]|nr:hypothetical protein [Nitriliruptorales bacterium]
MSDLSQGLDDGFRFRCGACGNLTRFDVVADERTRRYHHFDLGGDRQIEEEELLERSIVSVTCRWCGRDDTVEVEAAPLEQAESPPSG